MSNRGTQSISPTRNRILEVAARVLALRGYHDTNIDEVVNKSGTSKGGFYFHFPSKERMIIALVEEISEKLNKKILIAMANQDLPQERLSTALDALFLAFAKQRKLAQILLVNITGHGRSMDKKFLPIRNKFVTLIKQELDGAVNTNLIRPTNTTVAAQVWLGGLYEVIFHWLMSETPSSIEEVIPQTKAMLFNSIGIPHGQLGKS